MYAGNAPISSFLELCDNENVRVYLPDAPGKKRNRPTQVHLAMRDTLKERPQDFSILNGGIVLVARKVDVDDKKKIVKLFNSSILNGSQTQGELQLYSDNNKDDAFPIHLKYELIVTDDQDLIAEIAIARNFQNNVMLLSIVGRRNQLEDLDRSMREYNSEWTLQKSETDKDYNFVRTEKLLQVIRALIPSELWPEQKEQKNPNKVYTYCMKARCLKDFEELQKHASIEVNPSDDSKTKKDKIALKKQALPLYKYYLDIAPQAWELYKEWKKHPGFKGSRIQSIKRDIHGNINEVPDGIVFPIIASLSAFVKKHNGHWKIMPIEDPVKLELIEQAITLYQEVAKHKPMEMGKSKACYSELYRTASIYQKLSH